MMRGLTNAIFGVPSKRSLYRPSISDTPAVVGNTYWTVQCDAQGVRLYARRWPPMGQLIAGTVASGVVVGLIALAIVLTQGKPNHRVAIGLGGLAGVMALGGIWLGLMLINRTDSQQPDSLRLKRGDEFLDLPRSDRKLRRRDIVRLELAYFWTIGSSREYLWKHLVLVARAESGEEFVPLLMRGNSIAKTAAKLAAALAVPIESTFCGRYDWHQKSWS